MLRTRWLGIVLVLGAAIDATASDDPAPEGWTVSVQKLDGDPRRRWHLALVTPKDSRDVTIVVAPVAKARDSIPQGLIERSETGDLWQMVAWAEALRKAADSWKRPTLRNRPPASTHVVGVVHALDGAPTVESAQHGGRSLSVGDLLFVDDTLITDRAAQVHVRLFSAPRDPDNASFFVGTAGRVGIQQLGTRCLLRLHLGTLAIRAPTSTISASLGNGMALVPGEDSAFVLQSGEAKRLHVQTGHVGLAHDGAELVVPAGSTLAMNASGALYPLTLMPKPKQRDSPQSTTGSRIRNRPDAIGSLGRSPRKADSGRCGAEHREDAERA